MHGDELADGDLSALAAAAGMEYYADREAWAWRMECGAPWGQYNAYRMACERANQAVAGTRPADVAAADASVFEAVTADEELCRRFAEGRLGYYDAVLPKVASRVCKVEHARILDLGSFAGVGTLYLGLLFPGSKVVGVERLPGAVRVAEDMRLRCGIGNVQFECADYNEYFPDEPFDVVVSLQSMPTSLLPILPSETPESYARGGRLEAALRSPDATISPLADAIAAVRRLTAEGGCAVLHERLQKLPRALAYQYLLNSSGFDIVERCWAGWTSASQRDERQASPLIVARPAAAPVRCDESGMIELYSMPAGLPRLDGLPLNHSVTYIGFQATAAYARLPGPRHEVAARLRRSSGSHMAAFFGTAADRFAYVYVCDTSDERKVIVGPLAIGRKMLAEGVNELQRLVSSGQAVDCEPPLDKVRYHVEKRFR